MATTEQYLTQLQTDKHILVTNLNAKGVDASDNETFTSLVPKILDISSGGVEPFITNCASLFTNGYRLENLNDILSLIKKDSVTTIASMFYNSKSNTTAVIPELLDLSDLNPSTIKGMNGAFQNSLFTEIKTPIACASSSDTNNCYSAFSNCTNLKKLSLYGTSITNRYSKDFCYGCSSLEEFNTDNITGIIYLNEFSSMFKNCSKLGTLDLSKFQFSYSGSSSSNGAYNMFYNCTKLKTINFKYIDTSCWNYAFYNCSSLEEIDLSTCDSYLYYASNMFNGCSNLRKIDIRNMTIDSSYVYSYGSMLTNVPTDCLIIVKDDTAKSWFNTNFSNYTNIKTVSEYEVL